MPKAFPMATRNQVIRSTEIRFSSLTQVAKDFGPSRPRV